MRAGSAEPPRKSLATELFTRWISDPAFRHRGAPLRALPRQGPAPSFESLAQSVTKDVHPRTLLEEVCRLGLARLDTRRDKVVLQQDAFVPAADHKRMLGFVGANVGDHLRAAVGNVLAGGDAASPSSHLEQAVFADELSADSIVRLKPLIRQQWHSLLNELAPAMQTLIDDDQAQGRPQDQRVRVGMYAFSAAMDVVPGSAANTGGPLVKWGRGRRQE
jgi:hypothetical protein